MEEMVNMIVGQRAYETNSKAITTADEMLQTATNLKR
jgi:flagellar basal-body rod protein FlgG